LLLGNTEVKSKRKQKEFFDPSQLNNPNKADIPAVFSVALATKTDVIKSG